MKVYILFLLSILLCISNCNQAASESQITDNGIEFKHGVAIQNGKALYIDHKKMEGIAAIVISEDSIKRSTSEILEASHISFIGKNKIYVTDSKRDDPYFELVDTERVFLYKIMNNRMYISEDGKSWSKLNVRIIRIYNGKFGKYEEPTYMTIYLECKYFKGEYDLIGTPG